MLLLCLLAWLAVGTQADKYDLSFYTKYLLAGKVGVLGQAARVPASRFAKSPCQLLYLSSPDWATSKVFVDFGSAPPAAGCTRQAFLAYIDGYDGPRSITGAISKADIPWSSLVTASANEVSQRSFQVVGAGRSSSSVDGSSGTSSPEPAAAPPSSPSAHTNPPPLYTNPSSTGTDFPPQPSSAEVNFPPPSALVQDPSSTGSPSPSSPVAPGPTTPPSDDPSGQESSSGANSRRRLRSTLNVPLDRQRFFTEYDYWRDRVDEMYGSLLGQDELLPGPGGPLSVPILASGYFDRHSAIPADPRAFLDYLATRQLAEANGTIFDDNANPPPAGLLTGSLPVYAPLPSECREALKEQRKRVIQVRDSFRAGEGRSVGISSLAAQSRYSSGNSSSNSSSSSSSNTDLFGAWEPLMTPPQDMCFVTQLAILIYNDCNVSTVPAPRSSGGSGSSGDGSSNAAAAAAAAVDAAAADCSQSGSDDAEITCRLLQPLVPESINMTYIPSDSDVQIVVLYKPYDRCYRTSAQRLGQTSMQLIVFTSGLVILLTVILLTPTFFRLFISFPCRIIAYGFRKIFRRGRVSDMPLDTGLHSYKGHTHNCCFEVPVLRQCLAVRKYLLYAMCTVHSADGQYRALQVSVTSSVALMICMMTFQPRILPPIDYYIPPLALRIDPPSSDPMSSVFYFLFVLAYSLYLGFIGYLAMLCNFNHPRNKYYLAQMIMSVFFMLVLDMMVLIQVSCILIYWDRLNPQWPWLPMVIFQLANFTVSNVLLVIVCASQEERSAARRRAEYDELMTEIRAREANLALVKAARAAAAAAAAPGGTGQSFQQRPPPPPPESPARPPGGSQRRRAALTPEALSQPASAPPTSSGSVPCPRDSCQPQPYSQSQQQQQLQQPQPQNYRARWGNTKQFDDLAAVPTAEKDATATVRQPAGGGASGGLPAAESYERRSGGGADGSSSSDPGDAKDVVAALPPPPAVSMGGGRSTSARFASLKSLRQRWRERREGDGGGLDARWRKWGRPLAEDAAFRYPSWLLAALLVSVYMLVFTYARAMDWARVVGDCIGDPAECLNNNMARYLIFTTRLLGRDWQIRIRDSLDSLAASQTSFRASAEGALADNTTMPGFASAVQAVTHNFTSVLTGVAATQLSAALSTDMTQLINSMLGPDLAAAIPADQMAALQTQLASAVAARLAAINLTAAADPLARSLQTQLLPGLSASMTGLLTAVTATSNILTASIKVTNKLENWKQDMQVRFFWCSLAGFTLGLLMGLSSLVRTAISFRSAARKLRLARIATRVLSSSSGDGEGSSGSKWAIANLQSAFDEEKSIVRRSEATGITLVVFFFGVLLSTAIVQLYTVGVTLSIALALLTHPWTWTWLLPRYYMWVVAIVVGIILNKVILISFIGNTWLSNGDRIYRPAAWLAFLVIASATNLVIGLLLAVFRVLLLLLTTIFALGKLEVTLFSMFAQLDLPHQTFLAGLHLQESMSNFSDPIYLPGSRGRAQRRWRMLREALAKYRAARLGQLALTATEDPSGEGKAIGKEADEVLIVVPDPATVLLPDEAAPNTQGGR